MPLDYQVTLTLPDEARAKIEIVAAQRSLRPAVLLRSVVIDYVTREFQRIQNQARREERAGRLREEYERRERARAANRARDAAIFNDPSRQATRPPSPHGDDDVVF